MRGERYPKYKPTGIAWLPEVPEGWECVRLGVLGSLSNGLSKGGEAFGTGFPFVAYGDVYRNSALPAKVKGLVQSSSVEQKACSVRRGDVFFTRTSESIEEIGFSSVCLSDLDKATFAGFLIRFRPRGIEALPEFSRFYFRNFRLRAYFQLRISGLITRASLSQSVLRDLPVLLPPLATQRAIVAYLDEKCGKVDALVAAKEKEAALLKELKQSMIAEAVTGGVRKTGLTGFTGLDGAQENPVNPVNPVEEKRRLVPSGIPWLPEVPEGWEVKKVRQLAREGKTKNKGNVEKNVLSLSYGHIIRKKDVYSGLVPTDFATYQIVEKDYVVLRLTDLQNDHRSLRCGFVEERGIITSAYVSLIPQGVLPKYLYLALHTCDLNKLFYSLGGGLRQSMNFADVGNIFVPLPPLAEQREIVAYIEARAAKIDAAVKGLEREVAALKEYRERLIADVVTGQRRVG